MVWSYCINPISRMVEFITGILPDHLLEYLKDKKVTALLRGATADIVSLLVMVFFMTVAIKTQFIKSFRYYLYYTSNMSFIILTFSISKGVISKLLSHRGLVFLGEASFCLYMIHQMLIFIAFRKIITSPESIPFSQYLFILPAMLLLAILLSLLIHLYYEKPAAKLTLSLLNQRWGR